MRVSITIVLVLVLSFVVSSMLATVAVADSHNNTTTEEEVQDIINSGQAIGEQQYDRVASFLNSTDGGEVQQQAESFVQEQAQQVRTIVTAGDNTRESYEKVEVFVNSSVSEQFPNLRSDAQEYLNNTEPTEPDTGGSNRLTNQYERVDVGEFEDVTITDFEFQDERLRIDYNATNQTRGSIIVIGVSGSQPTIFQTPVTFDGEDSLELPLNPDATTSVAVIQIGDQFSAISEPVQGIIQDMKAILIPFSMLGTSIGMLVYGVHFLIFRRSLIENYVEVSSMLKQAVSGSMQPLKTGSVRDEELEEDDVSAIFKRYFSFRRAMIIILLLILTLYAVQAFTPVSIPLPQFGDRTTVTVLSAIFTYLFIAPMGLSIILRALFNPSIEYALETTTNGSKFRLYVAKRGTMDKRYKFDKLTKVDAENGIPMYLVEDLNREELEAVGAFKWTLSKHIKEEFEAFREDMDVEIGGELSGRTVNILEVITDPVKGTFVIKDMVESARDGQEMRENFSMIQLAIEMDVTRRMARGLENTLSGESVDKVLSELLTFYEAQEEELEEDIDKIKQKLKETDDTQEKLEKLAEQTETIEGEDAE